MKKYFLSLDQGTTSSRAQLIEAKSFIIKAQAGHEFEQHYPKPGQVEHDLDDILNSVFKSIRDVLEKAKVSGKQIEAIGITNQRETTCYFDSKGKALANAIVWQDRRTTPECERLKKIPGLEKKVRSITGLPIDPYFSATKMNFFLKKSKPAHLGTIDTFLLYTLTNGKVFATDATNASRTMLYDLKKGDWNDELLDLFKIPESSLPEIRESFTLFGHTGKIPYLPEGIPITCLLGDQQAALFGQGCIHKGEMKCTYGTGAFAMMNTGKKMISSPHGLLTTLAYSYKGQSTYALEGSSFIAGAAVQWLRDNLRIIGKSSEIEVLAKKVKNPHELEELFFLPFFSGLGSPYWNPKAKAALCGMTRDTGAKELAYACLEGIALSVGDLLGAMEKDARHKMKTLKVDGGAAQNRLLLSLQANLSQTTILRPQITETTAYGAGLGAAVGLGQIDLEKVPSLWKCSVKITPEKKERLYYQKKKERWDELISRLFLKNHIP